MMGMDQVLLIDEDGGLFKLEPPDSNIQRLNENTIRLNRVSSSEWCFWSISSDFEIFLYVYERQAPIQAIVSIQDKEPIESANCLPSSNWCWVDSNWIRSDISSNRLLKRFKLTRRRIFTAYSSFISIQPPFEFVSDIAIGGWALTHVKGYLSVWVVSSTGQLCYRRNVSLANPEGTDWEEVELPSNLTALSVSCTSDGVLWVVTCEGLILVRDQVTSSTPTGTEWIELESPKTMNPNATVVKITAHTNSVYVLDSEGYVFMRHSDRGTGWIRVLKGIYSVSVSMSNQLWALGQNKRTLHVGARLDQVESKLFKWTTSRLPFKFESLDAKMTLDDLDDLVNITV